MPPHVAARCRLQTRRLCETLPAACTALQFQPGIPDGALLHRGHEIEYVTFGFARETLKSIFLCIDVKGFGALTLVDGTAAAEFGAVLSSGR